MSGQLIAWFEKDDVRQGAYSPTDAVNLRADGFVKVSNVDPDTGIETPVGAEPDLPVTEDPEDPEDPADPGDPAPVPPPLVGAGSGTDEWRAYAEQLDVNVEGLDKRGDIVQAIKKAGHPVEQPTTDPQ